MIAKIGQKLTLFVCKHINNPPVPIRSLYVLPMFWFYRKPKLNETNDGLNEWPWIETLSAQKR